MNFYRAVTLSVCGIGFLAASCSGDPCTSYSSVGQYVAQMCNGQAPAPSTVATCQNQISNCNANDMTILHDAATCFSTITNCNQDAINDCVMPRQNLSQACQGVVNIVMAAYQSQTE